jgi:hypothetical protein
MADKQIKEIKYVDGILNDNGVFKVSVDTFTQPIFIVPRNS